MSENFDITPFTLAKSDQLNADDLIGGPIVVTVEAVKRGSRDQPVVVVISGGHCPWKPSKTSRRILQHAWGKMTGSWVGRRIRLYRDPSVKWAGEPVGGICIKAVSGISAPLALSLNETRGRKKTHRVGVLAAEEGESGTPTANLDGLLSDLDISEAEVDAWRALLGKGPISDLDADQRAVFAAWLASKPEKAAEIRSAADPDIEQPRETGERMSAAQVAELRSTAEAADVPWGEVEEHYGGPIEGLTVEDLPDVESAQDIYLHVAREIKARGGG